jgi:hypothetical protein
MTSGSRNESRGNHRSISASFTKECHPTGKLPYAAIACLSNRNLGRHAVQALAELDNSA